MRDRKGYQLVKICICILISAVFLISYFFPKGPLSGERKTEENTDISKAGDSEEPEPELYQEEGERTTVYFTNTEQIDTGAALTLQAQADLAAAAQKYLREHLVVDDELRLISDSLKETKEETSFVCTVGERELKVIYDKSSGQFRFCFQEEEDLQ